MNVKSSENQTDLGGRAGGTDTITAPVAQPDLRDPRVVLAALEADQVVAAKQQTRFGRRRLSPAVQLVLWALRIYVVSMLVLVAVSVIRAIHTAH